MWTMYTLTYCMQRYRHVRTLLGMHTACKMQVPPQQTHFIVSNMLYIVHSKHALLQTQALSDPIYAAPQMLCLQNFLHTLTSCESINSCCPRFSDCVWGGWVGNSFSLWDFTITDTDRPFGGLGMSMYSFFILPSVTRLLVRGGRGMSLPELPDVLGSKMSGEEDE